MAGKPRGKWTMIDVYKNACDDADCACRRDVSWPDNVASGCPRDPAISVERTNDIFIYKIRRQTEQPTKTNEPIPASSQD
jgi:hypothetical protein